MAFTLYAPIAMKSTYAKKLKCTCPKTSNTVRKLGQTYSRENAAKLIAEDIMNQIEKNELGFDFLETCVQIEDQGIRTAKEQEAVDLIDLIDTCFEYCYKNNKEVYFDNHNAIINFEVTATNIKACVFYTKIQDKTIHKTETNYTIIPINDTPKNYPTESIFFENTPNDTPIII